MTDTHAPEILALDEEHRAQQAVRVLELQALVDSASTPKARAHYQRELRKLMNVIEARRRRETSIRSL